MPASWFIAVRFLREGRMQTALIVAGVSVGVAVMVFLAALISGLQASLIRQTLGTQAHVVLRPPDDAARPLRVASGTEVLGRRLERRAQRERSIVRWQQVVRAVEAADRVVAVSPVVSGPAFAQRGDAARAIVLFGVDPSRFARIYAVDRRMVSGAYRLAGDACVVGTELASDLGVGPGDKVRVATSLGEEDVLVVAGVFDLGNRDVNRRWVVTSARPVQSLLDLTGGVTSIDVRVDDVFSATEVADALAGATGLQADSWMRTNAQLLVALRSQSSSSTLIQVFVVLAVMMGIASVLIVWVVQKRREIGILRAMGATRRAVLGVFLVQGAFVGLAGAVLGTAGGAALARFFAGLVRNADGTPQFPVEVDLALVARAVGVALATGLVAAVLPARSAARLDPAVAIRNG